MHYLTTGAAFNQLGSVEKTRTGSDTVSVRATGGEGTFSYANPCRQPESSDFFARFPGNSGLLFWVAVEPPAAGYACT